MSIFSIFKRGLQKTTVSVSRSITSMFGGAKAWTPESFDALEETLIAADFGVTASLKIVGELREQYALGKIKTTEDIFECARNYVSNLLNSNQRTMRTAPENKLTVILFVGVNGSGKTTTIGKLAARLHHEGKKVMLGAGDTWRAAAVEQLKLWAERTDSAIVASSHGADPASVAYDATTAALARGYDFLLMDTAGRQHTKKNLMEELAKVCRSIDKVYPGAPHEIWMTVDSSMGSNALNQAREFSKVVPLSGLVLTKLDGSGKGGMAVALHQEYHIPTLFVGLGEQPDDLQPFDAQLYANALFDRENGAE